MHIRIELLDDDGILEDVYQRSFPFNSDAYVEKLFDELTDDLCEGFIGV